MSSLPDDHPDTRWKICSRWGFFEGIELIGVGSLLRQWNADDWLVGIRCPNGVIGINQDSLDFWRKVGFIDAGESKPKYGTFIDDILILEKPI